jgi:MFS family permease
MPGPLEKRQYVRLLAASLTAMFLVRVAFGVTLNTLANYVPGGDATLGIVSTLSPLLEALTIIFAGVFIDRYGHKGILLTGLGLASIALYSLALTRNVGLIGGINALHGVASAFILVTTLAVIATFAPPEHRGREMGLFNFANIFGYVVGYAGAFVLNDEVFGKGHEEYTFVVAGALATAGLLFANRMIQLPAGEKELVRDLHHRPGAKDLLAALRNVRLLLLVVPWLIVFSLVAALVTFLPRVTESALQLSGGATAIGILLSGGLFVAAQLFWGWLADRQGRENIMLVGALGFAALMAVIVYAFFTTGTDDPTKVFNNVLSHRVTLFVLLFVSFAFAPSGLAAIADQAKEGAEGVVMSLYSLTITLGFILGPSVVGFISEAAGGRGMILFFAGAAALMLALVVTRFVQTRLTMARAAGGPP